VKQGPHDGAILRKFLACDFQEIQKLLIEIREMADALRIQVIVVKAAGHGIHDSEQVFFVWLFWHGQEITPDALALLIACV
jgi:hypothetical protein